MKGMFLCDLMEYESSEMENFGGISNWLRVTYRNYSHLNDPGEQASISELGSRGP